MAAGPPTEGKPQVGRMIRGVLAGAATLLLGACADVPGTPTSPPPPSLDAIEAALAQDISTLADDSFGGRFPGTQGEAKTQAWLIDRYAALGLEPAMGDGDWTQDFTLVRRTPRADADAAVATITRAGQSIDLSEGLIGIHPAIDNPTFADVPIFGVEPDMKELAPRSLVNRALVLPASTLLPRFAQLELADPKAIILTTADKASYDSMAALLMQGRWTLGSKTHSPAAFLLSPENSDRLMKLIGPNARRHPDGLGLISYDTILKGSIRQDVERIETANVVGRLPGKVDGSGAVLMLAHWDHLGDECSGPKKTDRLCNGAVDNASGLAVMTEAVRLALSDGRLDRDLIVLATSAEEMGLLGAEAFAADPPVPLPTIVAAFNLDTMAIAPRGSPVAVIGWGRTPLDKGIEKVVGNQGRALQMEDWSQTFLRRQDGWALLSRDVPAVLVASAFADRARLNAYMNRDYHSPTDDVSSPLELGGAAEDVRLHAALLRYFGNVATYSGGRE